MALANLLDTIIGIYIWLLIAMVVLTWLVSFNVLNTGNRWVYQIGDFLHRLTEPLLAPIRAWLPNLGGIDVSPVILILALVFVRDLVNQYVRWAIEARRGEPRSRAWSCGCGSRQVPGPVTSSRASWSTPMVDHGWP